MRGIEKNGPSDNAYQTFAVHSYLLSASADRHVGDILFTVCFFVCFLQDFGNVVTDISGVG